ncbi:NACHT domain-containing protein [Nostoc sp. KVJ3]|uniref:GUN4 domain-containing protein n=1 Tax=Nostoc sp. KVJ3 TaxID=457945 RepID=UPI0022381F30|nr:GUN4 domain-containing protein [Nostoc sp. KVJ3]MCW5319488.1 NACHT domain-containing protein [Nostoc sp. KVJ3]
MHLSGEQRIELREGLINAFPQNGLLTQMVSEQLNRNLSQIAAVDKDLGTVIFELIEAANSQGWVEALIRAARKANPGNPCLKAIAQKLLPQDLPPSEVPSDSSSNLLSALSIQQQKIFILVAVSDELLFNEELKEIELAIQGEDKQTFFDIIIKNNVHSLNVFDDAIKEERPQIVHICGWGNQDGSFFFTDDQGKDEPISPTRLAQLFERHSDYVKCVLIYSSYSFKAAKLISEYINYVIGMKQSIDIKESNDKKPINAERIFVKNFYKYLTSQRANQEDVIYKAFDEGCYKTNMELSQKVSIAVLKIKTQREYYQDLIENFQSYQTEGLSQDYALELPKVFVPLKIQFNHAKNTHHEMIWLETNGANDHNKGEDEIWHFLAQSYDKQARGCIVLLGGPGAGKSTLLKHLTLIYANEAQQNYHNQALELIPVLLLIRKVYQTIVQNKNTSLAELIAEQVINKQVLQWLSQELNQEKNNKCLIMLDGLDEVADESQRKQMSAWIDKQIQKYRNATFILTSRPGGYEKAKLNKVDIVLEVQQLKPEQVRRFISQWYLEVKKKTKKSCVQMSAIKEEAQKQSEDLIKRIRKSSPLAAMAVNPLLLTMICKLHDELNLKEKTLPEKRVELYREMCEVLLGKRLEAKELIDQDHPLDTLTDKDKQSVLQVLALKLMEQQKTEFALADGTFWIQKQLKTVVGNKVNAEEFIKYICNINGFLVEKELKTYQFPHLSVQEYLAAVRVSELKQEDLLIANINKSWWAETIRLYAAQNNATQLIRAVMEMNSPSLDVWVLAYDCLEECLVVDSNVKKELINRLEDGLESTDPETFHFAAKVRLIRRLRNFIRIDQESEIDDSYITCAEYQLFLDETGEPCKPQHWESSRFPEGDANETITGISWKHANRFCVWLGKWYRTSYGNQLSEIAVHYKSSKEEINSGISLVKFQLSSIYSQLADYLWNEEWQKANEETADLMNKRVGGKFLNEEKIFKFPCEDLRIIDQLWVYASKGHFGFSVQKKIYKNLDGTEQVWSEFCDRIGWRQGGEYLSYEKVWPIVTNQGLLPIVINFGVFGSRTTWRDFDNKSYISLVQKLVKKLDGCNI